MDIVRTYGLKFGSVACIDASQPPQAVSRQGQSKKCPDSGSRREIRNAPPPAASGQRAQRQRARARARGASLGHRHRHRGSLGRPSAIAHGPWALRGLPKEGEGKKQEARGQIQSTEQPAASAGNKLIRCFGPASLRSEGRAGGGG